jgi:hypothetical protein
MKSKRMRWVGHIAHMIRKPGGKRPLIRPRCGGEDNIRMDLREIGWKVWTGCIWLRIGTNGGLSYSCEHGNELPGSIKSGEFLDYMSDCLFLKKDSAPWS